MYIFIDESGDLGFDFDKKTTSKKFTIAILICDNDNIYKNIKKAVNQTFRRKVYNPKTKNFSSELKGSKLSLEIKKYFLNLMPQSGWYLYAITANKKNARPHLTTKIGKNKLYNYLTKEILTSINILKDLKLVRKYLGFEDKLNHYIYICI